MQNERFDKPVIRVHVWMETEDGVFFGTGRAILLEMIDRCGSLKKAAEELGMSYRAAWGKIKKTEEIVGEPLIEKISNKEGYRLTPFGKEVKLRYQKWFNEIEDFAIKKAADLFPWEAGRYHEKKQTD